MDVSCSFVQDMLCGIKDSANIWLDRFRQTDRHIYLFGAGLGGYGYLHRLRKYGVNIYAFCDNDKKKIGTHLFGFPIVSFQEMLRDTQKYVIISAINAFQELVSQCERAGISSDEICYVDWLWFDPSEREVVTSNVTDILATYEKCYDRESQTTFISALINRILRDRRACKDIRSDGKMYFDNRILHLEQDREIFLDCGASDGDTAREFRDLFGGKVYAFEPEKETYKKLVNNVSGDVSIVTVNAGLGDVEGSQGFNMEALAFENTGDQIAQLQTIDHSLPEIPTFIKMDIQGYEMNALRGAEKTIKEHKPKMAICVYHKLSDFFDVPMYVLSLRPDYKMYFRHYRDDVGDTVCYFV